MLVTQVGQSLHPEVLRVFEFTSIFNLSRNLVSGKLSCSFLHPLAHGLDDVSRMRVALDLSREAEIGGIGVIKLGSVVCRLHVVCVIASERVSSKHFVLARANLNDLQRFACCGGLFLI